MSDLNYTLGIDIGSTTVKVAILDIERNLLFSDYRRHFARIQETLADLLEEAGERLGDLSVHPDAEGGLQVRRVKDRIKLYSAFLDLEFSACPVQRMTGAARHVYPCSRLLLSRHQVLHEV